MLQPFSDSYSSPAFLSPTDQAQAVLTTYFALARTINPTRLYGSPSQIYGYHDPSFWHPSDVEAIANLNGILAHGLEGFPQILIDADANGLEEQLQWLVQRLAFIEIPVTIHSHQTWHAFCHALDGRVMGVAIASHLCSAGSLPQPDRQAGFAHTAKGWGLLFASTVCDVLSAGRWIMGTFVRWFAIGLAVCILGLLWWTTGPAEWSALVTKWNALGSASVLDFLRKLLRAPFTIAATFALVMTALDCAGGPIAAATTKALARHRANQQKVAP